MRLEYAGWPILRSRGRCNSSECPFTDVGTMPAHFRVFGTAGKRSAGVFLIPQSLDVGTAIDEILLIWLALEASEWENRLEWCRCDRP